MSLYKVLGQDGKAIHGGLLDWSLPVKKGRAWKPGKWHKVEPPIECCRTGLHLVEEDGIYSWYKPYCKVFEAEGAGAESREGNKIAFERARLIRPARIKQPEYWKKAIGFIERDIPLVPWCNPQGEPDPSWKLFEASSLAAAGAAAWAAAGDAAGDAARDAAWDAAGAAAGAAVWAAARAAAGVAAGDAARFAAWAAAGAAAWDAAWDAAMFAAGDAARDAGLYAQMLICDGLPLDQKHIDHIKARWDVWKRGYCLLCDVSGVLYVYAAKRNK